MLVCAPYHILTDTLELKQLNLLDPLEVPIFLSGRNAAVTSLFPALTFDISICGATVTMTVTGKEKSQYSVRYVKILAFLLPTISALFTDSSNKQKCHYVHNRCINRTTMSLLSEMFVFTRY